MMDFTSILKTVAPWLGTAIGGPLGGMAVDFIADKLGLPEKSVDAVKQAIAGMTPEQALALKQSDQEFALHMQTIGYANIKDLEELAVKDRDSARNREIQVKDDTNKLLATGVVVIWAILNILVIKFPIPDGSEQLVARLLGTMDAALMCVL